MIRRAILAAALLAAVWSTGCRRDEGRAVAVIPKSTAHLFWIGVEAGARAAGREFGLEILWNGPPTESDIARQVQIVDSMIARQVDGIAIAAAERKALVQPIERAVRAGIPVAVFDSGVDTDAPMSFIATDNVEAGRLGTRALAALINGQGKVAIVAHAPGSFSTMDREKGFEEVIAAEFPDIEIVARPYAMSSRAKALEVAENILTAHPDIDAFFASTEPCAAGVSLALKGRGLAGKVKLIGFDSSDAMIEDLKAGVLDATVIQDPYRMGYEAVKAIATKLDGGTPPARVDLPARVVTAADLDDPEVKRTLFPDWNKKPQP